VRRRFAWCGVLVLAGCASGAAPATVEAGADVEPAVAPTSPVDRWGPEASEAAFGRLERRLLEADRVRVDYHVAATGVVEAEIRGELTVAASGAIEMTAAGSFAGQPVDLALRTDGSRYVYGKASEPVEAARPPRLREALIIGLTRMGILHNVARLSGNAPPDHADGGVAEWVEVENFGIDPQEDGAVVFGIRVADTTVGSATLLVGPDGLPRLRRQAVRFPEGVMEVVERYSAFEAVAQPSAPGS
jgi:hypothetical protein